MARAAQVRSGTNERLEEVAALLAVGIRRLVASDASETADPSEQVRVDFSPAQSVHVTTKPEKETAR